MQESNSLVCKVDDDGSSFYLHETMDASWILLGLGYLPWDQIEHCKIVIKTINKSFFPRDNTARI